MERSRLLQVAASVTVHVVAVVCFLPRVAEVAPMRLPGTARGSRIELAYLPGRAPEQSPVADRRSLVKASAAAPVLEPKLAAPTERPVMLTANAASPSSAQPESAAGSDALGDGDVSIALAAFFPRPKPDLSSLAHGAAGDVILDVVIDSTGKISGITVTHSLGAAIDTTVIATVQQWTFHPATRDGQPVASEQELHFHYERG